MKEICLNNVVMDQERINKERMVLAYYLSGGNLFEFVGLNTSTPYLRIVAQTNNNHIFVLRMYLNNYPYEKPSVYVEMMLKDCHGRDMNSASSTNHTLSPHSNGWTQICHYHPEAWRPDLSLWLVYLKCLLWLNIYEETLRTGEDMEYYLKHQKASDVY